MAFLDKTQLLNDRIIQQLYRIKTIDRNSEWDVIWYLGGKNKVTLGEKAGKYYLLPPENLKSKEEQSTTALQIIRNLGELGTVYPELFYER